MTPRLGILLAFGLLATCPGVLISAEQKKTRDEQVIEDRKNLQNDGNWIYNDFAKAKEAAKAAGKPMMIVFRCIP